jgi:hypothetical protein
MTQTHKEFLQGLFQPRKVEALMNGVRVHDKKDWYDVFFDQHSDKYNVYSFRTDDIGGVYYSKYTDLRLEAIVNLMRE